MRPSPEFWEFVSTHAHDDPVKLRLKYASRHAAFDVMSAINQIECRRKCAAKLPELSCFPGFVFPSVLSAEQCTGSVLARFHASQVMPHNRMLDLTCGLGIDCYYMHSRVNELIACEIDSTHAEVARYNFGILGMNRAKVVCTDSIEWLRENRQEHFDVIFADPARRDINNKRTFALTDCRPDVATNLDLLRNRCRLLYVKASPMLDISVMCRQLRYVSHLWILSLRNECKELFVKCDFSILEFPDTVIHAIDFAGNGEISSQLTFCSSDQIPAENIADCANPAIFNGAWLYEPAAAVMKSGHAAVPAMVLGLRKLHSNTHLYISDELKPRFPGRIFHITGTYSPGAARKGRFKGCRRNMICRNFPIKPSELAISLKIKEGSDKQYLIAATAGRPPKHVIFDCELYDSHTTT